MRYLITKGSGFIGSALIRFLIKNQSIKILNIDKLTYASSEESLSEIFNSLNYKFINGDICNKEFILKLISDFKPNVLMHLAAESHVDRSIDDPLEFINTNILGTSILQCFKNYWINGFKKNEKN